jgi:hypothetical protein
MSQHSFPVDKPELPLDARRRATEALLSSVRVPPPMPEGFDPLCASPEQLELYGFPPRPDKAKHAKHAARWEKLMLRRFKIVPPIFKIIDRGCIPLARRMLKTAESSTSSNSCGAVITSTNFTEVWGEWIVPNPFPSSSGEKTYPSWAWIGIDSGLVAGTGQQVDVSSSSGTTRGAWAWYEWYPALSVEISNFTVSFGDTIDCCVWATSDTTSTIRMSNWGSNVTTSFSITAPSGTTLQGDSVGWIMQGPDDGDGSQYAMPNIQTTFFSHCYADTDSSDSSDSGSETSDDDYDLSDAEKVYMFKNGRDVCDAEVISDTVLLIASARD